MFDPERDDDSDGRRFYLRLLAVVVVSATACLALWPSVTGFAAGADHDTGCLAIADGWHADKGPPSPADIAAAYAALPPQPTPAQRDDPAFMDQWRAEWRAAQSSPAVLHANAQIDWLGGPGVCVRPSRHRLIVSGLGLGGLTAAGAVIAVVRRTRTNLRPAVAEATA